MKLIHGMVILCLIGLAIGLVFMLRDTNSTVAGIIREYAMYKSAVEQFQTQYAAVPGDFDKATELWGIAAGETGSDVICYTQNSLELDDPKRTCNGNGNGKLLHKDKLPYPRAPQTAPEWFRAWQHLANAGLVEGQYPGLALGFPRGAAPGKNVPASRVVEGAGYTLMSYERLDHPHWFPGHYFGLAFGSGPYKNPINHLVESRGPIISTDLAMQLDHKMDDGNPATGKVRAVRDLKRCVGYRGGTYRYLTEHKGPHCGLFLSYNDPGFEHVPPKAHGQKRP